MGWADLQLERVGDFDALVCPPHRWSSATLHDEICRWASLFLEDGLTPGDRVLLKLPPGRRLVVAMTAAVRAGGVAVVLSPTSSATFEDGVAESVQAKLSLISEDECAQREHRASRVSPLPAAVPRALSDLVQIVYTSGSTGAPKGIPWTHGLVAARYLEFSDNRGPDSPTRRSLCVLPLWSAFGTQYIYLRLLQKMQLVMLPGFRPHEVATVIRDYQVESAMMVPTMLEALLESDSVEASDLASFKSVMVGGSPLTKELAQRFRERFGTRVTGVYGLTELGPVARTTPEQDGGTLGRLTAGVQARVVSPDGRELGIGEIGEILVRAGARAAPSHSQEWFATGDLGSLSRTGELIFEGRSEDRIEQGGLGVFLEPIRSTLAICPGVRDCAVIGVPDPFLGQAAVALVVTDISTGKIWDWCRRHLERGHGPSRIHIVEGIPRSELGKLSRDDLLKLADEPSEACQAEELSGLKTHERAGYVDTLIGQALEQILPGLPGPDTPLGEAGLDSLAAVAFAHHLTARLGKKVSPTVAFNHPTRARLRRHLLRVLFPSPGG